LLYRNSNKPGECIDACANTGFAEYEEEPSQEKKRRAATGNWGGGRIYSLILFKAHVRTTEKIRAPPKTKLNRKGKTKRERLCRRHRAGKVALKGRESIKT